MTPRPELAAAPVEPVIVEFVIVLLVASLTRRMVPAVDCCDVFEMVRLLPAVFSPSIVTLSAPFRSIKAPAMLPVIDRAPVGWIRIDVYDAAPDPLALRTAETLSTSSAKTVIVITP